MEKGFFKRPTGIAIDNETHEIYVTDTLRDKVYILDSHGTVLRSIGQHGGENGEFNYPTELLVKNGVLAVVDAMNFRVQNFDRKGAYEGTIGSLGDSSGTMFRPKGIGLDSETTSTWLRRCEGMWRCTTARVSCFIPSAGAAQRWGNSSFRQACSLTGMIVCTWRTRTITGYRYSSTTL